VVLFKAIKSFLFKRAFGKLVRSTTPGFYVTMTSQVNKGLSQLEMINPKLEGRHNKSGFILYAKAGAGQASPHPAQALKK
jgi:hypothetical protein